MSDADIFTDVIQRYRHLMVRSLRVSPNISDADLIARTKGDTADEKLRSMRSAVAAMPPSYWQRQLTRIIHTKK